MSTIGIDLGTSTTEISIFKSSGPEMVPTPEGRIVIPSAVGLDGDGNWVVGERARAQYMIFPERTAIEVKRKTGTNELIPLGKQKYLPVELQAKLLSYVKLCAEEHLGEAVDQAVISVPAYFNELQRRETVAAGKSAGFSVERILNEPTAAAMSYGLSHLEEESLVLVYDLGGGTFDVTLLEMFDGVLEVKASSGDNALGGKDFDERIIRHLNSRFEKQYGQSLLGDLAAQVRIKEEAEKCKIALSTSERYQVLLPAVGTKNGKPVGLDVSLTRREFEEMTRDLLERTHDPIDQVLSDAGISEDAVDHIILVGGSTRMPMVQDDLEKFFGREPERAVDPDFAVAQGAAIMAGMIDGKLDTETSLIMTDVCTFSLGIGAALDIFDTDVMSVIIPRNTTLPVTRTEKYATLHSGQTEMDIVVYQGESEIASHNQELGRFHMTGIPKAPAHEQEIQVSFSYDLNGLLRVRAVIVSTGKEGAIEINMRQEGERDRIDVSGWKEAPGALEYRSLIRAAEKRLRAADGWEAEKVENALYELKRSLVLNREEEIEKAADELRVQIGRNR